MINFNSFKHNILDIIKVYLGINNLQNTGEFIESGHQACEFDVFALFIIDAGDDAAFSSLRRVRFSQL